MPSVLAADALTTLSNLKEVVGIASTDTSKDNQLERCINRATWVLEEMTNRKKETGHGLKARKYNGGGVGTHGTTGVADTDYIYFSGETLKNGGDTVVDEMGYGLFYLPAYPVQANSVLTFALDVLSTRTSAGETWSNSTFVEWADFVVEREKGVLRLLWGQFSPGYRNYRVTMAAGYQYGSAQPYVPPDLEEACIELAKGIYRNDRTVSSESIGSWSRTFDTKKCDPVVEEVISKYRRYTI